MKKKLSLLLATAMMCSMLGACAPKTPDPFAEMEFAYHHLRPIIH